MAIQVIKQIKVAKIVDEYSVVINQGSNYKIKPGDVFEIYCPGSEIIDPDTGESLGALDYIKAKIVARDVFPKMSVCHNQDRESILTANLMSTLVGRIAELNVAAEDISGGYTNYDPKIRVGDLVRKISSAPSTDTKALPASD